MTLRARLLGLLATLALIALVAGIPAALLALGANPLPDTIPTLDQIRAALTSPDDGTLALRLVAVAAWVAWLVLTASVVLELAARIRGARVPRIRGLGGPQLAAHQLITAAALLFIAIPATGASAAAAPAVTHLANPAQAAASVIEQAPTTAPVHPRTATALTAAEGHDVDAGAEQAPARDYTVRTGDTLSDIAQRLLGDANRWPELVTANPALADNPDLIHPGTVLHVPTSPPAEGAEASARSYTVRAGDTLSGIAKRLLGDASRYPEIFAASRHTPQPGGIYLTHPDQIDIGQTLTIPTDTNEPGNQPETRVQDSSPGTSSVEPEDAARAPDQGVRTGEGTHLPPEAPPQRNTGDDGETAALTGAGTTPHGQSPRMVMPEQQPSATAHSMPSPVPASAGAHAIDPDTARPVSEDLTLAPWMLTGLTGAGALLAGGLLLRLRQARAASVRHRQPGRTLTAAHAGLHPVEKSIAGIGEVTAPTVEHLDTLLRRLAANRAHAKAPMPELAAVELTPTAVVLHLTSPADLPAPWDGDEDHLHWSIPATCPLEDAGPDVPDHPAPYPLLVTIGLDESDHTWLLNLEDTVLTVTGDHTYAQDLIRHIALEASCAPWSHNLDVTALGTVSELAGLGPERITIHDQDTSDATVGEHLAHAIAIIDRTRDLDTDPLTARAHQLGEDAWPARLLILNGDTDSPEQARTVQELLALIETHPARTGTGVIVHTDQPGPTGTTTMRVTGDGRLRLIEAGLDLIAVGLTSDEAEGCATLLALADTPVDTPVPADQHATDGWPAWSDQAGALRAEHTQPRTSTHAETGADHPNNTERPPQSDSGTSRAGRAIEPTAIAAAASSETGPASAGPSSLLPAADHTYTTVAATTSQDLHTLAPRVSPDIADQVLDADPTLDEDLAMWLHPDCALPRLHLLGPVHATTRGEPLIKRRPYMTELLAFIALRRHGATSEEVAEVFSITPAKARDYVLKVRRWLGTNPRTGQPHLPDARSAPAAAVRGVPVYQVIDLLTDADLFRRLRLRGQARGADGIDDLITALSLVQGRIFDYPLTRAGGGGWTWLIDGDRHDQHLTLAVVDVAHIVTTHALAEGDLTTARRAAQTALIAAPDEEIPRLDLAAIAASEGDPNEAQSIIRDDICNRTDDHQMPPEIPTRTEHILEHHTWVQAPENRAS